MIIMKNSNNNDCTERAHGENLCSTIAIMFWKKKHNTTQEECSHTFKKRPTTNSTTYMSYE